MFYDIFKSMLKSYRAQRLENLGIEYKEKYDKTGAITDLEIAIQHYHEALGLTLENFTTRKRRLAWLVMSYYAKYSRTEAMVDLEASMQYAQISLDITPNDHPWRPSAIETVATTYRDKYDKTGMISDLEIAIQRYHEALDMTLNNHPERLRILDGLGGGYIEKYNRTGAITDLSTTIQYYQDALDLISNDIPKQREHLESLGIAYYARYDRTGWISDLNTAIRRFQEAFDLTPQIQYTWERLLDRLGTGYYARYERNGAMTDLNMAIQRFQKALEATPNSHSIRSNQFQGLKTSHGDRFRKIETVTQFETCAQRFLPYRDSKPDNQLSRASRAGNLGTGYYARYNRTNVAADLEMAIQQYQKALDLTPDDHSTRARRLHDVAFGYHSRYSRTRALIDLESSIQMFREALDATPSTHLDRAIRLQNLGNEYYIKYDRTNATTDLEMAIQQHEQALDTTPHDHPNRSRILADLAIGYVRRYSRGKVATNLNNAIQRYQEALEQSAAPIADRLRAGHLLLRLLSQGEKWPSAMSTASVLMSLVPQLTPRYLDTMDRQHLLAEIAGLASNATAVALMSGGNSYQAIELLESGRSMILGFMNEIRADISALEHRHPKIAEEYAQLRYQLDTHSTSVDSVDQFNTSILLKHSSSDRYHAGERMEQMVKDIRCLPGFSRFMLAPLEEDMKAAAISGPVVVINVSAYRCDALIVERHGLQTLQLPDLHLSDIQARTDTLTVDSIDTDLLEWLWMAIANPILRCLKYIERPRIAWPRVCWILTGPLTKLPIHAAGKYTDNDTCDTVLDRVISSYTSSIRALVHARQDSKKSIIPPKENMVLVEMAQTPGYSPLLYATEEIELLSEIGTSMNFQVKRPSTQRKEVLSAIDGCEIFHFAGHGYTDQANPSQSAMVLSDGRLTVESLFEINLSSQKPFLAYLSACGTGQMKHQRLMDEGLHLINACQLAGFRHVVGTLWEVNDRSCVAIARDTYEWIRKKDMSNSSVSEGLHHAIRAARSQWSEENAVRALLRRGAHGKREGSSLDSEQLQAIDNMVRNPRDIQSIEDVPMTWIPYVHFGI